MEDAIARKERLKALKEAAAVAYKDVDDTVDKPAGPALKFRNYAVKDEKRIDHEKVAPAQPPKFEEPAVDKKEEVLQEDVLVNVAPKKANWDLKRDVEKKLEKLERRTQRAILEIMQAEEAERMREEGTQE
ncbi:hypothetical protein CEUSTIGMA_g9900.t1 [Chlamydomonas eustigma]|uniref:Coiled-coil domain-containing protein 12 n=1 Tax=Chlamydomonas eustigma TaxID=1157962 RepID=A0A250XHF4_9CHLO|nr:hypothetical protein CEUSTIGMA_g9900.t1 [Chlamydomonas eustigma]|eukprot:GAX82473.1 hypothetical protein CEUSTIGMA_g9900.t1 [Chlamydomonas eustigma]